MNSVPGFQLADQFNNFLTNKWGCPARIWKAHPENEADENSSGPGSFVIIDPDGNAILVDQHV